MWAEFAAEPERPCSGQAPDHRRVVSGTSGKLNENTLRNPVEGVMAMFMRRSPSIWKNRCRNILVVKRVVANNAGAYRCPEEWPKIISCKAVWQRQFQWRQSRLQRSGLK